MKPNEGYLIDQEDLIAQLGLLILEGRIPQDAKSNLKDCKNCDVGIFHHRKEDFLSLWKASDSMYIEVWLCSHDGFVEKEAIAGHSGYLLIEQWQIDLKLNRNSDHGFHCTEKMLTQAIKSKLYFSQLSAWLSLTEGEYPRHTYFRLCQTENKTSLKRFIRAPDFHQFPQVNITSTKNLAISYYSLPHTDLPLEYPMFSWVLADTFTETPRRPKFAEKPPFESPSRNVSPCIKNYAEDQLHVVRKLEFGNHDLSKGKTSDQQQICVENFSGQDFPAQQSSGYISKEQKNVACNNKNVSCETSRQDVLSLTMAHFGSMEVLMSESGTPEETADATEAFEKCSKLTTSSTTSYSEHCSDTFNDKICESKELNVSIKELYRTSNTASERKRCGKGDPRMSSPCYTTEDNTSSKAQEYPRNVRLLEKQSLKHSRDLQKFRTDLGCSNQGVKPCTSTKSDVLEILKCSRIALKCQKMTSESDRNVQNMKQVSRESERSNMAQDCENSQMSNSENFSQLVKKSWSVNKYGDVLHRTKTGMKNILPEVRHVMDEEYKKTLEERVRKCCVASGKEACKRKPEESGQSEDNVFVEQKCKSIPPRKSNIAKYHLRHASTGTLPIFHPSTGLPVSSSPAPFRKTSQKQVVDDTCSPSCESSSLTDRINNLSKSAPALTTQSLLGNFEESVLNDRLCPDGVVEGFTAELSASGSKKCLAHVTLPVQAYFFKLSDDNAPSPYMGYIPLDVPGLPKKGYHVPKKGTIQLTLFNPNQTVVKVFVVLYDFSDIHPNFQTFLRQKTTSIAKSEGLVDTIHDNLHYLIHLRFASSKSGRVYLHTDIRVIFARQPPDQVRLRTSTNGPTNPKYVPRQDTQEEF